MGHFGSCCFAQISNFQFLEWFWPCWEQEKKSTPRMVFFHKPSSSFERSALKMNIPGKNREALQKDVPAIICQCCLFRSPIFDMILKGSKRSFLHMSTSTLLCSCAWIFSSLYRYMLPRTLTSRWSFRVQSFKFFSHATSESPLRRKGNLNIIFQNLHCFFGGLVGSKHMSCFFLWVFHQKNPRPISVLKAFGHRPAWERWKKEASEGCPEKTWFNESGLEETFPKHMDPINLYSPIGTNIWGVSENRGFPPKSSILTKVFHYKPSILGYHYFWKHPYPF